METIFIVNPQAGQGKDFDKLTKQIKKSLEGVSNVQIYQTKCVNDARDFVKKYCQENGPARFIACGGDGTLNEVINGVIDCSDAEIGVIPFGTGNDFCRNFKENTDFFDARLQKKSDTVKCDVIRCVSTDVDGEVSKYYSLNMLNIGFDCNVAAKASELKKKPFISGPFAYIAAVFVMLVKKAGEDITVLIDGNQHHEGKLLLTSVANGRYCGGGIKSNPLADVKNGFMNINIIYNISRFEFLKKLPFYMKGTHIKLKKIEKFIFSKNCKKVEIIPKNNSMRISCDGEIKTVGKTEFEIIPNALNFVVPKK